MKLGTKIIIAVYLGTKTINDMWLGIKRIFGGTVVGTEAEKVIDRMTAPSQVFQDAITEYVESEQAASGDNWALTDEVQAFNVDTEVNALTGWKQFNPSLGSGAPIFVAYDGYTFVALNTDGILCNFRGSTLPQFDLSNAHVSVLFKAVIQVNNSRPFSGGTLNNMFISTRVTPDMNSSLNGAASLITNTDSNYNGGQFSIISNAIQDEYYQGSELIGTGVHGTGLTGLMSIGYRNASNNQYFDGVVRIIGVGAGVGFDAVSHAATQLRFSDRMLIAKHQAVVDDSLNRYTALTPREEFALGRLAAKSEEDGNWKLLNETFILGLYTEANALIGMKSKTATNNGATFLIGNGFENLTGSSAHIDSNFNPLVDGTMVANDGYTGGIINSYGFVSNARPWHGLTESLFQIGGATDRWYQGGVSFASTASVINGVNHYHSLRNGFANRQHIYINKETIEYGIASSNPVDGNLFFLNSNLFNNPFNGVLRTFTIGEGIGFDVLSYHTNLYQCVNELEIGQADNVDYNVQDKTYDWSNRELAPDQLEELTSIILANSDSVTTGRVLNIIGNLGVTINARGHMNNLINIYGWTIIEV